MKKFTATFAAIVLSLCTAPALTNVASYSSGVLPTVGTGAAHPSTQGWTASTLSPATYNYGAASTVGGWRITDATTSGSFYYTKALSTDQAASMSSGDWTATWTVALSADAVSRGSSPLAGSDNYYSSNIARQTNTAMWIEVAGDFAYVINHRTDASGNVILSDGTSLFNITSSGNQLAQEVGTGAPSVNFLTLTLSSVGGQVFLTDSLGGNYGTVSSLADYTPVANRVAWGSIGDLGQGASIWNSVTVYVPEPTSAALFGLGMVAFLIRRKH